VRDKTYGITVMMAVVLLMAFVWYTVTDTTRYDESLLVEPEVEYHLINITTHEVNREAYAYLDDNGTLIWQNRYHLAFDYTIEMTYNAPFKGDVDNMWFWLKVNNETIAHGECGWPGLLTPGERRTLTGTYTPDVWVEDGANLTVGFDFWHTYVNSRYGGHRGIGRMEVDAEAPWEVGSSA
jgi:hypothetical protein